MFDFYAWLSRLIFQWLASFKICIDRNGVIPYLQDWNKVPSGFDVDIR